ncbi:hypothetical protein D3C71_1816230 [compost metagenome]
MPHSITMDRARLVAIWISPEAPEVTFSGPNLMISASRPPNSMVSRARAFSREKE